MLQKNFAIILLAALIFNVESQYFPGSYGVVGPRPFGMMGPYAGTMGSGPMGMMGGYSPLRGAIKGAVVGSLIGAVLGGKAMLVKLLLLALLTVVQVNTKPQFGPGMYGVMGPSPMMNPYGMSGMGMMGPMGMMGGYSPVRSAVRGALVGGLIGAAVGR
ncbi:unnamed protein product [Cylicocyclus nassatus]|uniref:Uncharacterized protein n=1 Tax=Cylicocyclus nassatus TaxID=53992 RepID=A0AA36GG29_CYLNA|nr:unnamed protein product [Cylicocyclus nassatus]